MEKFTVDLDKVLDEFEFSEEQAIRHALQHFKREDLPATKYQKPHFKPINLADADFRPCIETTMTYPSYHDDQSQQTSHPPAESNPKSLNCSIPSPPPPAPPLVSDYIEPPRMNSWHEEKLVLESQENAEVSSAEEEAESEARKDGVQESSMNACVAAEKVKGREVVEGKGGGVRGGREEEGKGDEDVADVVKEAKCKVANGVDAVDKSKVVIEEGRGVKDEERKAMEDEKKKMMKDVKKTVVKDEKREVIEEEKMMEDGKRKVVECEEKKVMKEENKKMMENEETVVKDDEEKVVEDEKRKMVESEEKKVLKDEKKNILENEETKVRENETKAEPRKTGKIPEEHPVEEEPVRVSSSPEAIQSDKAFKDEPKSESGVQSEPGPEPVSESEAPVDAPPAPIQSRGPPVEEAVIERTEMKPIQFESQVDITDEELARYLEELEEEEEEEQKRRKEAERKPSRPDTLDLREEAKKCEEARSPGLTPLARGVEAEEGAGSEEENLRNESREDEEAREDMEVSEELESLVESSELTEPSLTLGERRLGKVSPFWMPDHLASSCMECGSKFTVIKRRHHCRACGRILCSKCCGMRASLEYLQNQEQRVCETCFRTLAKVMMYELQNETEGEFLPKRRPNPNNPMEYCSTVPPPLQVSSANGQPPPSVLVPVGVLKREGSSKVKEAPKQVMFSDGIRPGGDLTELDGSGDHKNVFRKPLRMSTRAGTPPGNGSLAPSALLPPIDPESQSFIVEKSLPPICMTNKGETTYEENWPLARIMERLKDPNAPPLHFAINRNLVASVKIVKLDCCMKETCWVIVSKGMGCVGQDELIVLLTVNGDEDDKIPKEVFLQFHYIYQEAARGNTLNELGCWCVKESTFLDSRHHGGFLFIRPTFQCLNRIETPPPPFLVGVLIHRSEIPWARVFPFRLILRLGAEFRYYPCPLVSVRFREPVYYEIGHTIINLLADFRNLSYTIPSVRGLRIHMEANQTSILIPRNRYDQVVRALNNSNDPVLALAGNFSPEADAHLVCMQSKGNEVTYSTHAININDKPRKVTGASFVVLNGALKTTSGVAAKSSIVEDGLMVQVPSETMTTLRTKLRNMEDWSVRCGPVEGRNTEEVVRIIWSEDDKNFNVGVKSVIDNMALDGVPSIRVHSGKDYMGCTKFIRWTQVFIIKCEDGATSAKIGDPLEVNKLSEGIARATCIALTKFLELLAASGLTVLAVRTTIDQDNVGYEAGSNGEKLAPIYMNELDNELVPVLHKAASVNDSVAILELIFHIMDQ